MTTGPVSFSANRIKLSDGEKELDYPVADAFQVEGKVIVLYRPDAYKESFGQFPNLVAFDLGGNPIWKAELPTNESGDSYTSIISKEPLVAYSWTGFDCTIDISDGRIIDREFVR